MIIEIGEQHKDGGRGEYIKFVELDRGKVHDLVKGFFLYIFLWFFVYICTSAAPQRPAHGTVSSQVAAHLRTDRVCRVLGRSWIRTQDY